MLSPLPASCPGLTGAHSLVWQLIITTAIHSVSASWGWWHGDTRAPRASLDALRMKRNVHVCFCRATSWQNIAVRRNISVRGMGVEQRDGYRKKHLGRQEDFCHQQEQGGKFEIFSLWG